MLHRPVEVTGVKPTFCICRCEDEILTPLECLLSSKAAVQITPNLRKRRAANGQLTPLECLLSSKAAVQITPNLRKRRAANGHKQPSNAKFQTHSN